MSRLDVDARQVELASPLERSERDRKVLDASPVESNAVISSSARRASAWPAEHSTPLRSQTELD